ncbi:MAG TPA: dephospho-CoA kinase [Parvularculaceae bacterium]|nr:dephospho-CoA kinase [Parvularculaceae bacterium]
MMIVVGLTGSIGMGKSTVLKMFEALGAAAWNADDAVHRLYAKGAAGALAVAKDFPEAIVDGAVDREKLAALVLGNPEKLRRLEEIVHPLVSDDRADFLARAESDHVDIVMLDIPLLFEKSYEEMFDAIVVVSAPADVQRARVLARPGMTEAKFEAILAQQTPDAEKRARADYVIDTGLPLEETKAQVEGVMSELKRLSATLARG